MKTTWSGDMIMFCSSQLTFDSYRNVYQTMLYILGLEHTEQNTHTEYSRNENTNSFLLNGLFQLYEFLIKFTLNIVLYLINLEL